MLPEHWQEINKIFSLALSRPPSVRPAYLDVICSDNAALREPVAALLAAVEEAANSSAPTVTQTAAPLQWEEKDGLAGTRIGAYLLEREAGRGGMGLVYLATRADGQFEQTVALKLVKPDPFSQEWVARFQQERQTLARLHHPNIALLHDGGVSEQGWPYFAMEYIDGLPIDLYCQRQRLNLAARLRLFREVMAAVQYAHQNLIVHRDLKPSNILVTSDGVPKLLDFGIAKWLNEDAALHITSINHRVLTPEYASPEQIKGEAITTASDIYTLGVLLYHLLTGRSPYRLSHYTSHELERAIREQEPEPPSAAMNRTQPGKGEKSSPALPPEEFIVDGNPEKWRRSLRGDLDNITLKALAKEPAKRYSSVEQFSEDLRRHFEGLPVSARPNSLTYLSVKFMRRNKAVMFASAMLMVIVIFMVNTNLQSQRISRERDKTNQVSKFLEQVFIASDPNESRGDTVTARELLDRGATRVRSELRNQPEEQARLLNQIGDIYRKLGRHDRAEPLLREALEIRRRIHGNEHIDVTASLNSLGSLLQYQGKYTEAEPLLREALSTNRKLLGNQHYDVAISASNLGLALIEEGKLDEAEPFFHEAVTILRWLFPDGHEDLAATQNNLGLISMAKGDYVSAEREFRDVLVMTRKVLASGNPTLGFPLRNLATALYKQKKYREALPLLREALPLLLQSFPEGHWLMATVQTALGGCLTGLQEYAEAEIHLRPAHDYLKTHLGNEHKHTREAAQLLIMLYEAWGKPGEAEVYRSVPSPLEKEADEAL